MAVVELDVQVIDAEDGIDLTDQGSLSVSDTYTFPNDGKTGVHLKKSGAGACTVTVTTPGTDSEGNAIADKTFTVPATTGDIHFGPFRRSAYNDADGNVTLAFSNITGLTVAVFRMDDD